MLDVIHIENLKCNGCATTIRKAMEGFAGVAHVEVINDEELVKVEHDDQTDRAQLVEKLGNLGYPEVGHNSLGKKAKSYISCAVGRMS